jgi:hypothetical protein
MRFSFLCNSWFRKVTLAIYLMMLSAAIGLFAYYLTLKSSSVTQFSQISQTYLTGQDAPPIPGDQQPSNTKSLSSSAFLCTNLLPLPFPTQFACPVFALFQLDPSSVPLVPLRDAPNILLSGSQDSL